MTLLGTVGGVVLMCFCIQNILPTSGEEVGHWGEPCQSLLRLLPGTLMSFGLGHFPASSLRNASLCPLTSSWQSQLHYCLDGSKPGGILGGSVLGPLGPSLRTGSCPLLQQERMVGGAAQTLLIGLL